MIRHGHKAKEGAATPRPSARPRVIRETTFVVQSCPDGMFRSGAEFKSTDIYLGLRHDGHECLWPEGMVFTRRGKTFTVRGGALIDERGNPFTAGQLHGRKAGHK